MLNPSKTAAAAAFLALVGSPLAAQVAHEGMTCSEFRQSTPETQTEVVESFVMNSEDATAAEMANEEIVSMILDACADEPDQPAISMFNQAIGQ